MLKKVFLTLLMASSFNFNAQATAASIEKEEEEISSQILAELPLDVKSYILSFAEPSLTVGKKTEAEPFNIETKSDLISSLYGYYEDDARREIQLLFPAINLKINDFAQDFLSEEALLTGSYLGEIPYFKSILSMKGLESITLETKASAHSIYFIEMYEGDIIPTNVVRKIAYKHNKATLPRTTDILSSIANLTHFKFFGDIPKSILCDYTTELQKAWSGYNFESTVQHLDLTRTDKENVQTLNSQTITRLITAKNLQSINLTGQNLTEPQIKLFLNSSLKRIILSGKAATQSTPPSISTELREKFKQAGIEVIDPQGDLSRETN